MNNRKKIKYLLFTVFLFVFTIPLSNNLNAQSSNNKTKPAILFIHGLAGKHTTWDELLDNLPNDKFVYYGNYTIKIKQNIQKLVFDDRNSVNINNPDDQFPCFTIDFSDNQNLSFHEQAFELKLVIDRIKRTTNVEKVILFAHSMGGIASRQYIADYYNLTQDIAGLVTVTSPHLGSYLGYLEDAINNDIVSNIVKNGLIQTAEVINVFCGIDYKSRAVKMLTPGSIELNNLYNTEFPIDIPIVQVMSKWIPEKDESFMNTFSYNIPVIDINRRRLLLERRYLLSEEKAEIIINSLIALCKYSSTDKNKLNIWSHNVQREFTDGIVTIPSQDIRMAVKNGNNLSPVYLYTDRFHMETNKDIQVMKEALLAITAQYSEQDKNIVDNFIGFIIDSSGSMEDSDPNDLRKLSVEQIINLLSQDNSVFIVDFDNNAEWINKDNWNNINKQNIISSIRQIDSRGGTNIGLGLEKMKLILENRIKSGSKGGVLLFSDGKGDYNNQVSWFQQQNIPVYTISYTDNADAITLNNIAKTSGGIYLQANDEHEVVEKIYNFYVDLNNNSKIWTYNDIINESETKYYSCYIDHWTDNFVCNCTWFGSTIDLKLISPEGIVYDNNQNSEWYKGSNYVSTKIRNPVGGLWSIELKGINIPPNGEPFSLNVSGKTPNIVRLINTNSTYNGLISFELVNEKGGIELEKIKPTISVITPTKNKRDISSFYKNGKIIFQPIDGKGNYNFSFELLATDINGDSIQRHFVRTVFVGENINNAGSVIGILGQYITVSLGKWSGVQPGISCNIFNVSDTLKTLKARGYVFGVKENTCSIRISEFFSGANRVNKGDFVEIDKIDWQNDN